jgi:glycosyltransferase involved in cell wall biosynthesis
MTPVDVSVLVPVYNNATTLDELLDRLIAVLEPLTPAFEIILVDDGSRDASPAILGRRAAEDPRLRVFTMVRNFGSQAASCAAIDRARGRRIVHLDADLENYPEDIPKLLESLDQGYDLVCGYRESRGRPLMRVIPSLLVNAYVRWQTGTNIRDVGCALRAVTPAVVHDLASEGEARRLLTPVVLRRAQRIIQVPVRHCAKTERGGHSFFTLLGMAFDYFMHTARRPFLVSGVVAVLVALVGAAMVVVGPRLPGLVVLGFGALGALASLLGEYVQRIYLLAQNIPFYKLRDDDAGGDGQADVARMASSAALRSSTR